MGHYDSRTKLVVVMCLSSLGVYINDPIWMFGIFLFTLGMAAYFKSPIIPAFHRMKKLLGVLIAMVFIQSVFTRGGIPIFALGDITLLSSLGLYNGMVILFRFLVIILSATILVTSSSRDLVQGLSQWGIPYEMVFMISLAIRFLPLLKEEALDTYTALQLRGIEFEKLSLRKKIKIFTFLIMPLIYGVLNKARELSIAIEMRGFRGGFQRTNHRLLKFAAKDYLWMISVIGLTIAAMVMH